MFRSSRAGEPAKSNARLRLSVDLEQIEKRGKELPVSYALLRRLKEVFGIGFVDIILGDGLYINAPFFNLCLHEIKSDVVVKTDDTSLLIIKDAIDIFSNDDLFNIAKRSRCTKNVRIPSYDDCLLWEVLQFH